VIFGYEHGWYLYSDVLFRAIRYLEVSATLVSMDACNLGLCVSQESKCATLFAWIESR